MKKKDIPDAGCSMFDASRSRNSRSQNHPATLGSNQTRLRRARIEDVPFGSNCVQLPGREWIVVGIIFSVIFCLAPGLWERFEKFEPDPDYRLPYELSGDYWLYNRYCRWACSRYETLVIGDSVVWGHYVPKDNTLSHYLNENAGRNQFANLGVDGIHPAALEGLLRYYGRDISGKNVILHLNPLWMSSRKHDLQIEKEHHFNHPKLVPQFTPAIACYKASYSTRLSVVVKRYVHFLNWTSHLNITYFQSMDIPEWTLEHPYKNPLEAVTFQLPTSDNYDKSRRTSRPGKGPAPDAAQWVELQTSLQWRFFRRSVELLKARGNRVFVLVGPFNEHMLEAEGIGTYRKMKVEIETWLRQNNVPYYMPPALPSALYRDASHPLSGGYSILAKQLYENESFRSNIVRATLHGYPYRAAILPSPILLVSPIQSEGFAEERKHRRRGPPENCLGPVRDPALEVNQTRWLIQVPKELLTGDPKKRL